MFRRNRKQHPKGWDAESIGNDLSGYGGLRERLGSNNKLWMACLIGLVILSAGLIARNIKPSNTVIGHNLVDEPRGYYTDQEHKDFEIAVEKMAEKRAVPISVAFFSDNRIDIVFPGDVTKDELIFISRFAARRAVWKFSVNPEVLAYTKSSNQESPTLAARFTWSARNAEFAVNFEGPMRAE